MVGVAIDNEHTRWAPLAWWYAGPVGVLGEYIRAEQEMVETTSGSRAAPGDSAWQLTAAGC